MPPLTLLSGCFHARLLSVEGTDQAVAACEWCSQGQDPKEQTPRPRPSVSILFCNECMTAASASCPHASSLPAGRVHLESKERNENLTDMMAEHEVMRRAIIVSGTGRVGGVAVGKLAMVCGRRLKSSEGHQIECSLQSKTAIACRPPLHEAATAIGEASLAMDVAVSSQSRLPKSCRPLRRPP